MTDAPKIVVAEGHRPGAKYGSDGRYPTGWSGYYETIPEVTEATLSAFLTSPSVEDRIAAHVFLDQHRVRLPEVWVVIEDPETSPNLQRDFGVKRDVAYSITYHTWSAHVDEAEAIAWRDMFQSKSDALCDQRPWWGPSSRRKFTVVRAAGAPANQLRQPGAEPRTQAFQ